MATPRRSANLVTLADPRPGTVVGVSPGSQLWLRFRSGIGSWRLAAHPGNLLPLVGEGPELSFLVFEGAPATLRLERRHPRSDVVSEVRELRIEVGEAELAGSGRRSA